MRISRVLQVTVLLSFMVTPHAWASAITGEPEASLAGSDAPGSEPTTSTSRRSEESASPFDFASLFDDIGPLIRVSAPTYLRIDLSSGSADGGSSATAILEDIVATSGSDGGAADLGNVGFDLAVSTPAGTSPILYVEGPSVPEAPALLLLAPAVGFLARRVISKRARS